MVWITYSIQIMRLQALMLPLIAKRVDLFQFWVIDYQRSVYNKENFQLFKWLNFCVCSAESCDFHDHVVERVLYFFRSLCSSCVWGHAWYHDSVFKYSGGAEPALISPGHEHFIWLLQNSEHLRSFWKVKEPTGRAAYSAWSWTILNSIKN